MKIRSVPNILAIDPHKSPVEAIELLVVVPRYVLNADVDRRMPSTLPLIICSRSSRSCKILMTARDRGRH